MTGNDLQDWLNRWGLQPIDGAKVLLIQKSKMSEYLNDKRSIPAYVAAHVETFDLLAKSKSENLIKKRMGKDIYMNGIQMLHGINIVHKRRMQVLDLYERIGNLKAKTWYASGQRYISDDRRRQLEARHEWLNSKSKEVWVELKELLSPMMSSPFKKSPHRK